MNSELEKIYLDWINNFLTIEVFASHYGITVEQATTLINLLRSIHKDSYQGLQKK